MAMSRGPQSIGSVLAELIARRGLGRVQSAAQFDQAWQAAVGPTLAPYTRVGTLKRGKLEVIVANSTLIQELNFQKTALLRSLAQNLPDQKIQDLRFRLGAID